MAEELAKDVLNASPRGLDAAPDAAARHRFAGHARKVIDLGRIETAVDIGDPGHLPLTRAHVRRGHVDAGADVAFMFAPTR
jgi:hypothetical protein